jgi:uncharacterized membrane protein YeaQ/YmgE (transglycosylase-associated protein family)
MSLIWTIIIGFITGVIAKFITPGDNERQACILTTILGIVGAFVGHLSGPGFGLTPRRSGGRPHWRNRWRGDRVGRLGIDRWTAAANGVAGRPLFAFVKCEGPAYRSQMRRGPPS